MIARTLAVIGLVSLSLPAAAQTWQIYSYPADGFAVQLPASPAVTKGTFTTSGGTAVPANTYSLEQDGVRYTMTVADFSQTTVDQQAAIDEAVKALGSLGEIKLNVSERIDRQFGRQLSLIGKDGSHAAVSVFFVNHRLYELDGAALPPQPENGSSKAMRFQQSLDFIGTGDEQFRPENPGGDFRPGRRPPPPWAFEDCRGKEAGAALKHALPDGVVVDATCRETPRGLAAIPNRPPPNR